MDDYHLTTSDLALDHRHLNFPPDLALAPSSSTTAFRPRASSSSPGPAITSDSSSSDEDTWQKDAISQYGIAGRIWEASYLLSLYLQPPPSPSNQPIFSPPCSIFIPSSPSATTSGNPSTHLHPHSRPPCTILELGSGAAHTSLRLASDHLNEGDLLILTDLEEVVPLMTERLKAAQQKQRKFEKGKGKEKGKDQEKEEDGEGELRCDVQVRALAWGDVEAVRRLGRELGLSTPSGREADGENAPPTDSSNLRPLTHILLSDCIYFPPLHPLLITTLLTLTEPSLPPSIPQQPSSSSPYSVPSSPEIIIAFKTRSDNLESPFWLALSVHFSLEPVVSLRTGRRLGHDESEGGGEMGVVIARRKREGVEDEGIGWEELAALGSYGEGVFD